MSNEKPVELTEALFGIIFGHQRIPTYDGTAGQRCTGCDSLKGETDGPNSPRQARHLADLIVAAGWVSPEEVAAREAAAEQRGREDNALHDMCYVSGSKALEAREAAARREALLEGDAIRAEAEQCLMSLRAKVARVEALAEAMGEVPDYTASDYDRGRVDQRHANAEELWAVLAEPDHDEESGR